MRITVSCPQDLIPQANQLAMCLVFSEADGNTYGLPNWQDATGNLYAAASFLARPEWIDAAQSPLVRPEWDTEEIIDMDAAAEAQAALVYSTEAIAADPAKLTAIGGMEGIEALEAMGLVVISEE
jgi:hypothetical protein